MDNRTRYNNLSDEELLLAYRAGKNNELLGYLLQRYTMLLLGVGMKYLKDKALSEDAVQQVFLKALTHLPKTEVQNFKGWLYILMRNHCLQVLRDKSYRAGEEVLANLPEINTDKEELLWKNETIDQMNEALKELNEEQKTCVVMFYLDKKSYQQISERTGFNFTQVKSYIQNGKRNLKQIIMKKVANKNK